METNVAEKLKQVTVARAAFVDFVFKYIPRHVFELNAVFHSLLFVGTVTIIVAIFSTTRKLTLFSLHPVFMTIGTFIFLAEGIVSYRNSALLDFLSPIMQHNKKIKVRAIHQSLQTTGGLFLTLGILFIMSHKMELGKTIVPVSVHSAVGTVAILMIIVQIVSGQEKLANLDNGNRRVLRWHGDLGLLCWDTLCLTVLTGSLSFLPLLSVGTFLTVIMTATVWLCVHTQMLGRAALHKYDSAYDMDGSGEALSSLPGVSVGNNAALGLNREDSFGALDVEAGDRSAEGSGLIEDSAVGVVNSSTGAFDKAFARD